MSGCVQVVIPTVDNTPLECNDIISSNCMKPAVDYPYFGTTTADLLTTLLTKIRDKVKGIEDGTIILANLPVFIDDTAAGIGGLLPGKAYKDTVGYIRYKL